MKPVSQKAVVGPLHERMALEEFADKPAQNEPQRPKPVRLNRHQRRAKAARQRKQGKKS